MTNQKVFNKVAKHLLTQMKRAVDEDNNCRFRTTEGLMCAVGCLIPPESYRKAFDSTMGLFSVIDAVPILRKMSTNLLSDLQDIHDDNYPSEWRSKLNKLAKSNKLSTQWMPTDTIRS